MSKKTIGVIIAVILAVAGFMIFTKPAETSGEPSNHTVGEGTSGVTLIEYGDFQCGACKIYYPVLKQVKEVYGDQITFQFRHFPLESIHVNGRAGSRAAEAAGLQDKFFEMHDMLYENQLEWETIGNPIPLFESYAQSIGLDMERFKTDYRSSVVNATISADIREGQNIKADSTPTFVLDGIKLEGTSASVESLSTFIDEAILKKTGTAPIKQTPAIQTTQETTLPVTPSPEAIPTPSE